MAMLRPGIGGMKGARVRREGAAECSRATRGAVTSVAAAAGDPGSATRLDAQG